MNTRAFFSNLHTFECVYPANSPFWGKDFVDLNLFLLHNAAPNENNHGPSRPWDYARSNALTAGSARPRPASLTNFAPASDSVVAVSRGNREGSGAGGPHPATAAAYCTMWQAMLTGVSAYSKRLIPYRRDRRCPLPLHLRAYRIPA